ncbi:MAG: tungsten ABC transporter substrate-binding protein, partial [Planctomycetota bacterium]|jgi:tungstate transport system substrate-binding protein
MAYCLVDRGTYLAFRGRIELKILLEGDKRLFNPYGVIAVDPARHPHVKYEEAMGLIAWMTSREGREIIGSFKVKGEVLFHPSGESNED